MRLRGCGSMNKRESFRLAKKAFKLSKPVMPGTMCVLENGAILITTRPDNEEESQSVVVYGSDIDKLEMVLNMQRAKYAV